MQVIASPMALLLIGLSFVQHLVQGQSPTSTTSAAAKPVPTFQNTPGLMVVSPRNEMTVNQDTGVAFNALLSNRRPMSSVIVTVAKIDGSSNTTLCEYKEAGIYRFFHVWNASSSAFPVGDYYVSLVVTPNMTTPLLGGGAPTNAQDPAPTSAAAGVVPTLQPSPSANVYYWKGLIHLAGPSDKTGSSNSAGTIHAKGTMATEATAILVNMSVALGVLSTVFALTL